LLSIFVLTHITAAILSFRMIYLVPHHLPALIGFGAHGRVDHDQFSDAAAWQGTRSTLNTIQNGFSPKGMVQSQIGNNSGAGSTPKAIGAPQRALPNYTEKNSSNMDSTLHASTDISTPAEED